MTDGLSEGCNQLIKEGAELIISVDTFIKEYFEGVQIVNVRKKEDRGRLLSKKEREVYNCIDYYPKNLNQLMEELNGLQSVTEIMNYLLSLEIKKYIVRVATNSYIVRDGV
jgi:DNA processing protein